MTEKWVPIPGHIGSYEVSNHGQVRSLSRVVQRSNHSYLLKGRVLKPSRSGAPGKDYLAVSLARPERLGRVHKTVHRLVLESFIGPCPAGMEACHNNGDRFDNRLENLRWDTRSSNNLDKNRHGTNYQVNKTHCSRGHEYTADNTVHRADGGRRCRTCRNALSRRDMQAKLSTPEGRAAYAAYVRDYRRSTGRVDGLGNQWARRTHCNKGHEFTPENTLQRSDGGRRCRTCQAAGYAAAGRRATERRRSDPAKREARNAYVREYRKRTRST